MGMEWNARTERERAGKRETEGRQCVRQFSIPPTSLSETLRSTVFTASLTASVVVFCAAGDVEKARGAKTAAAARAEPPMVIVRTNNDIVDLT